MATPSSLVPSVHHWIVNYLRGSVTLAEIELTPNPPFVVGRWHGTGLGLPFSTFFFKHICTIVYSISYLNKKNVVYIVLLQDNEARNHALETLGISLAQHFIGFFRIPFTPSYGIKSARKTRREGKK